MEAAHPPRAQTHLRQARIAHNWRQRDLAELLGTTVVTIRRWEQGSHRPGAYFRVKLCALFGASAEELGLVEVEPSPRTTIHDETIEAAQMGSASTDLPTLWNVPYPRNPFFTGREELLSQLHTYLHREHTMALTQSWAIGGLGGIGKTQIALEYAYRYRQDYCFVFWVSAATPETLLSSLATIADLLHLPERDEHDQHRVVSAIKKWLATRQHWLFIVDNVDDLRVVQDLLPSERPGHLLLTTRLQALGALAQRIEVETMGMVEAMLFLLRRAKLLAPDAFLDQASQQDLAAAESIVMEMDFLPLALDQAGAYIYEVGCSLTTYLELFQTHRKELLRRRGNVPTDHPESVVTTWSLSFQKIEQVNPGAAELLYLLAFLEPDSIPEELISEGRISLGPILGSLATDAFLLNEAIEELRKFSLVQRNAQSKLLRIHRLVQAVLQERMEPEAQQCWVERALCVTNAVFPETIEVTTWARCQRYLPQAQMSTVFIQSYGLIRSEAISLLFRVAIYLRDAALYERAEPLLQQALQLREQMLGPDHPEVASLLNELARLYTRQGKYVQAGPLYQRALSVQEHRLGSRHIALADTLNGLALLCTKQGKYEQAEPLYQRALDIREQTLGPTHLQVAQSLNNLARLYAEQGKYQQAEGWFDRALQIREQVLGADHPDVASPLQNLAILLFEQGKYERAEALFDRALQIREQTVGPHHPETALTVNSLGTLYQEQGKYEQAERMFQRAFHIWEQMVGPHHPDIAHSINGLAFLYLRQEKYQQAEPLFQRALHIWEQALGPMHLNVASPLDGLASLYQHQGNYEQAERLFLRALQIREQAQIQQHPDMAEALQQFATMREAQGNSQAAAALYRRAFSIRRQILGPDHPKVIDTRERLRAVSQALGETQGDDSYKRLQE